MDRQEAKELLPIIQAYAEGKVIQVKDNNIWKDVDANHNCVFLPDSYEYRIKPEPKYRPFETMEECWQEMQKHQPFGWVKVKDTNCYKFLVAVQDIDIYSVGRCSHGTGFRNFTFMDGTPFGIKIEA